MLISAYANGSTAGCPPTKNDHERGKRGAITGWSASAVRRHTKWLYSVEADRVTGDGYALTLTIRDCPPDHLTWGRMLRSYWRRLERRGLVRGHYVIEWQRRGTPHVHAALYFPAGFRSREATHKMLLDEWLAVASVWGARAASQHVAPITGPMGWLKYLSKHAARGVRHYQRVGKPKGWERTGRLWGHLGEWPIGAPMQFDVAAPTYHRFRRLARSWRIAAARADLAALERTARHDPASYEGALRAARRRISAARSALGCSEPKLSAVRGVSDWIPESTTLAILGLLWSEGHDIAFRSDDITVDSGSGEVLMDEDSRIVDDPSDTGEYGPRTGGARWKIRPVPVP